MSTITDSNAFAMILDKATVWICASVKSKNASASKVAESTMETALNNLINSPSSDSVPCQKVGSALLSNVISNPLPLNTSVNSLSSELCKTRDDNNESLKSSIAASSDNAAVIAL